LGLPLGGVVLGQESTSVSRLSHNRRFVILLIRAIEPLITLPLDVWNRTWSCSSQRRKVPSSHATLFANYAASAVVRSYFAGTFPVLKPKATLPFLGKGTGSSRPNFTASSRRLSRETRTDPRLPLSLLQLYRQSDKTFRRHHSHGQNIAFHLIRLGSLARFKGKDSWTA
jgi:hypothetical protein